MITLSPIPRSVNCLHLQAVALYALPQALQLSSVPTPLLATLSSDLCGELDSAQDPLLSGYIAGQNRASPIYSPLVDHTRGYSDIQGHAYSYPTYAIEQSSGYPQETGGVSSEDLDDSFAGPTTYLGPIPSLHDYTSGQVIGSDAPSSQLSDPLLPLLQDPPSLGDFNVGDIPVPPEQTQTEMAAPPQFISSSTIQPIKQVYPSAPFPYIYLNPSPSNPTSYSGADGHMSCPFLMLNQNSSSQSPQGRLGYPFPIHPHSMWPAGPSGFHGRNAGSKMELFTSGTLDDHSVWAGDQPSRALSNNRAHPLRNHSYIPDNNTTGGGVDDYGNVDDNKFNTEPVVGLRPQLLLPPNQLPLSPELHSCSRVSRIDDGNLSGTSRHTRHFATARSKIPAKLAKARSVCDHATSYSCGWRVDKGRKCGIPINYDDCADHFAAFHHIKDMAWNVEVICCWCPSKPRKKVTRKNLLRHLREAHLCYPRSEKGI